MFVDNGAPVLLTAHIDTIQSPRYDGPHSGAGFDDRLGVYVGHQLVKAFPQWFDLLLTDYEESIASTAKYFVPSHRYNWVVGLDREEEDFVDYGLASDDMLMALDDYGFTQGIGSYSDICALRFLRVSKINMGLGTYNSHDAQSGYRPDMLERQLGRLLAFTRDYAGTAFPYRPRAEWY